MAIVGRVAPGIHLYGVREAQAAFKQVDRELPKQLKRDFLDVADHVVGIAQQKMPFRTGEAARSLRPTATQKGAGIRRPAGGTPWRGERADYYPWLDFGGRVGRRKSIERRPQPPKGGNYLYPAIEQSEDYIKTQTFGAVIVTAKGAGFTVR